MKKLLAGSLLLVLCAASCGQGKGAKDPFAAITQMVDSVKSPDISPSATPAESQPMPLEADELFDDFIFNYAQDEALQRQRTVFPLPYNRDGHMTEIERKAWTHDPLFTESNIYTLLFDREQDMDIVGDTSLNAVQVEWLFLKKREMKKYFFQRTRGMWMLDSIALHPIKQGEGGEFVDFYTRFVSDSLYQRSHIHTPCASSRWILTMSSPSLRPPSTWNNGTPSARRCQPNGFPTSATANETKHVHVPKS